MISIKQYILKRLENLVSQQCAEIRQEVQSLRKDFDTLDKRMDAFEQQFQNYKDPRWSGKEIGGIVRVLQHNRDEARRKIQNLEKTVFADSMKLNQNERSPRIIVSLTSFPRRIGYVGEVIEQMLIQTMKPDEIILWLSKEQFPKREKELPENLLKYQNYGVKIEWCEGDIKAYKKFVPTLKKYPDDIVIIIDDDLVYPIDLVENLYKAYERHPGSIIASRVHEIAIGENGKIQPYEKWKKQIGEAVDQTKEEWFFTGGAGTLLPPHAFDEEILNEKIIKEKCLWADDIWLNIHAARNRVPIINAAQNYKLARLEEAQRECLQYINREKNDIQLKNLTTYYKEQLVGTIYERM